MTVPQSRAVTPRELASPFQRVHDARTGSDRGCLLLPSVGTAAVEDAKEEDAEEEEEEEVFPAGSPVPLSALRGRSHYSAWVQASNSLGAACSASRRLNLQELGMSIRPSVCPSVSCTACRACMALRTALRCRVRDAHEQCSPRYARAAPRDVPAPRPTLARLSPQWCPLCPWSPAPRRRRRRLPPPPSTGGGGRCWRTCAARSDTKPRPPRRGM